MYVLGLMSGTSADGVDAVLASFSGDPNNPRWSLLNSVSIPYPADLREVVINAGQGHKLSSQEWLELSEAITEINVESALICDPDRRSQIIGCHGQTVWHRPFRNSKLGGSLQLLRAPLMATKLNRPVIYDFRAGDMALAGQGAPLVPQPDSALLKRISGWRAVLNLGGIANMTLIPPNYGPDSSKDVLGWDCGPANSLVDLAIQKISDLAIDFDLDGKIAENGTVNSQAIARWLKEPFFQIIPPKSTGREEFGYKDLLRRAKELEPISLNDLIATLTAFTAAVVDQDLEFLYQREMIRPIELIIAGGGSRNPVMTSEIKNRCDGIRISTIDEIGIPSQAREALIFALLAWWNFLGKPGTSPSITGAIRSSVLGCCAFPA